MQALEKEALVEEKNKMLDTLHNRGGSAVGSTLRSCAQGPGFEPCLYHDAHDVPVLCQLAV